jgi:hypothetical protein
VTLRQTTGLLWMLLSTGALASPTELMPGDSQAAYLGNEPLEYLLSLESGDSVQDGTNIR